MNKFFFHSLLTITLLTRTMEQPPSSTLVKKSISKKELIIMVNNQRAHEVLQAVTDRNAATVIDAEVLQIAQSKMTSKLTLSRAGSIFLMLSKHAPKKEHSNKSPSLAAEKSPRIEHSLHHSSKHHKEKKYKERTPQEELNRFIKKKDLKGLKEFASTSGVHFIDEKAVAYAQKKYDLLSESSNKDLTESKEFLILQLLKKYDLNSVKDRRKSYAARSNSKKEERP